MHCSLQAQEEPLLSIGILDAFPSNAITINWNHTPVDVYIRFLEQVDPPFAFTGYAITKGEFPAHPDERDAYLITGSPRGVYDADPWITELINFIRESYQAGKKIVGICFGHQILAHALNGCAAKSEKGWGFGLKRFDIYAHKPWMTDCRSSCNSYFAHQDQVIQLPPNAELIGGNGFCPNLFFTLNDQILGFQGHPEFTTELMSEVIAEDKKWVKPHVYQAALQSLNEGAPDNQLFAQWIVNFLLWQPDMLET
jgi:GMP synthase-like glutamine amidotransferase